MTEYQWFVEAPGAGNEIVARMLSARQKADESIHIGMKDSAGNPYDVWAVDYRSVAHLFLAAREFHFRFKVFNRKGSSAPIRDVTKLVRGWLRSKSPAEVMRAKEELEHMIGKKKPAD